MKRWFLAVALLGAWTGCGDTDEGLNCPGGECVCRDEDACAFDCEGDGCIGVCERATTCDGLCGDACGLTCRDTTDCDLTCGQRCTILCERADSCSVDCAEDCDVTCRDLSTCDVTMGSGGTVLCERVGACDVTCPGDLSPTDCGNGLLACPPITCPN